MIDGDSDYDRILRKIPGTACWRGDELTDVRIKKDFVLLERDLVMSFVYVLSFDVARFRVKRLPWGAYTYDDWKAVYDLVSVAYCLSRPRSQRNS